MYTFTRVLVFCVMLVLTLTAHTRPIKQKKQDPCSELRFMALMNEAPTISATDIRNLPHCFNGKFISDSGSVLEYQDPKARKRISDWYAKERPK